MKTSNNILITLLLLMTMPTMGTSVKPSPNSDPIPGMENGTSHFLIPAFPAQPTALKPYAPEPRAGISRFTTTIHFSVREKSPELDSRSKKLVMEEFSGIFQEWPEFKGKPFKVVTNGNEVMFLVTSPQDFREPIQKAMTRLINNLNGKVRTRGRSQFFRTTSTQPIDGWLEVLVDNSRTKILSISAQAVPLRDVLKEIKTQVGSFSYLVPGDCARQLVDWNFGREGEPDSTPKSLDSTMKELAALFNLKMEKQNITYIFSGQCQKQPRQIKHFSPPPELFESLQWGDLPSGPNPTEVTFSLDPMYTP